MRWMRGKREERGCVEMGGGVLFLLWSDGVMVKRLREG
jgi:hypothetical protein